MALAITPVGPASAVTGPYTLPFFWPIYALTQGYGCTGVLSEPAGHGCAHWHGGLDWGTPTGSWVASSNQGTLVAWKANVPDNQSDPITGEGNYATIKHSNNRFTTYYHLRYNGLVIPATYGTTISAGKHIAYSGNTGPSNGPHLHYELHSALNCVSNTCDLDPNQWTTATARVPWRAQYSWENNPNGYSGFPGTVFTHVVKFKNVGGRTWTQADDQYARGRLFLAATTPPPSPQRFTFATRTSASYVPGNWELNWLPGKADQAAVGPDGLATFTFNVVTSGPLGARHEQFNLDANGLFWFDYWESGGINGFYVPIYVVCC